MTPTQTPPDEVARRCLAMTARVWPDVSEETKAELMPLLEMLCEGEDESE